MPAYQVTNTFDRKLGELVEKSSTSKTKADVINRAVALYEYLQQKVSDGKYEVAFVEKVEGTGGGYKIVEIVKLP